MKMRTRGRRGFTLLEIMIALSILVISIIGLVSVISYTTTHNEVNRENLLAMRAAEAKIEEMRQFTVSEIFARYSVSTQAERDSLPVALATLGPPPPSTAYPGPNFSLSLTPPESGGTDTAYTYSRLRNVTAIISFPRKGVLLWEDPADPDLIARDLNMNQVSDEDATSDYRILPTTITITWTGIKGARTLTYRYMFLRRG